MSILKFKVKPYDWQLKAIDMAEKMDNIALLAEMGTGKSGACVNILRLSYTKETRMLRTLILSPLVTLFNWKNEFKLHSTIDERNIMVVHKGAGKRKAYDIRQFVINHNTQELSLGKIVVMNYEGLLNEDIMATLLEWKPEILVCDESHLCKNPDSKRTKRVITLADRAKKKIIMTGTPILNSVQDIYAQYRILDGGESFGKNYFVFRSVYMEDENAAWSNKTGHYPKFVARPESYQQLTEKIYAKSIRVLKSECLDLPPLIKMINSVELSAAQRKHYDEMKRDFMTFITDKMNSGENKAVLAQVAVTKALRLQQIVTGYMTTEDGSEVEIEGNPRLDRCTELVEELAPNHKIILWCSFKANYRQLSKMCTKLGISHCFLTGEQSLTEKEESMNRFNNDPTCRVIIANRRAGGIGVNLIAASYSIVYSRNFSLAEELQSESRNHRGGSQIHEQIVKIDLVARDTIDEYVLEALGNKQQISDDIIDVIKNK